MRWTQDHGRRFSPEQLKEIAEDQQRRQREIERRREELEQVAETPIADLIPGAWW